MTSLFDLYRSILTGVNSNYGAYNGVRCLRVAAGIQSRIPFLQT